MVAMLSQPQWVKAGKLLTIEINIVFATLRRIDQFHKSGHLLWYPRVLHNSNICEILLYNQRLVVITYEIIYGVGAAHR